MELNRRWRSHTILFITPSRQDLSHTIHPCHFPHTARTSARIPEDRSAPPSLHCLCLRSPPPSFSVPRRLSSPPPFFYCRTSCLIHLFRLCRTSCAAPSLLPDSSLSADLAATATAFTLFSADQIRFAASLYCSAAEPLFCRNPTLYGPYNLPYRPYNLSASNHRR